MLFDPFKTTRKVKVPPHSRIGHRERMYIGFAKVCFWSSLILILFTLIAMSLK